MSNSSHIYRITQSTTQVSNYVVIAASEREAVDSIGRFSEAGPLSIYVKVENPVTTTIDCVELGDLPA